MKINGKEYDIKECADLHGADLRGADLSDADLSDANLSGADLRGANLPKSIINGGMDSRGYTFIGSMQPQGFTIIAGCRYFTVKDAREHWKDNPEALQLITNILMLAQIRGIETERGCE